MSAVWGDLERCQVCREIQNDAELGSRKGIFSFLSVFKNDVLYFL